MTAYCLPAVLDTTAAAALRGELLGRIETNQPLILDGAEVDRVGQACLQVLVSARLEAKSEGIAFRVEKPSGTLIEMATIAGLLNHLDLTV